MIASDTVITGPGMRNFRLSFHFISFIDSGCEAKDSQKSELNHYTSQEPSGEKTRKEVSVLDVGGKPQRIQPGKNPSIQVGPENPIHIVPPVGFEPWSQR